MFGKGLPHSHSENGNPGTDWEREVKCVGGYDSEEDQWGDCVLQMQIIVHFRAWKTFIVEG